MKKQIKTKLSRILCTALTLCMIISLIPVAFAAETEEAGTFTIHMVNDVNSAITATYDNTGNVWAYGTTNTSVSDGGSEYGLKVSSTAVDNYVTITFKAPATGKYKLTYNYYKAAAGGYGDIYVVPNTNNVSGVIGGTNGKIISEVCYYNNGNIKGSPITSEGYVSLSANTEYLVVFAVSKGYAVSETDIKYRMFPTSLTFTSYDPINAVYSFAVGDYSGITPEGISYANSGGRLEYYGKDEDSDSAYDGIWNSSYACIRIVQNGWVAYKIRVPAEGEYKLTLDYKQTNNDRNKTADVYIIPASYGVDLEKATLLFDNISFNNTSETLATSSKNFVADSAGEYLFIFHADSLNTFVRPAMLTLSENSNIPGDQGTVGGINDGETNVYNEGDKIALTYTANNSVDGTSLTPVVSDVKSSDESIITIADNTATAVSTGKATITANINGYPASLMLTVNDPELTDAFDDAAVSSAPDGYVASSVDAIEATGKLEDPVAVSDGSYKITASETNDDGKAFLYWKKAMSLNEKIVSFEREFNYVPESEGRNILVAVYEGDINLDSPKCYNANGQYLPDVQPNDADLPSMAGYGKAYGWKEYGDTNVWVAQYSAETPEANINVHISGGNGDRDGGSASEPLAAYGDLITCTTSDAHKTQSGQYFKYWKRVDADDTETIVSTDETYSFKAWESCEIVGVYSEYPVTYSGPTRKILIDSFTAGAETGVMAEFLGFGDNVVEKGIMFNGNRIAMTTVGNQFSVIADEAGTYVGYAIVNEDGALKLITDGSYAK